MAHYFTLSSRQLNNRGFPLVILNQLMSKLNEAEFSIQKDGTISADNLEKQLGIISHLIY
jgi:hypothetical protein